MARNSTSVFFVVFLLIIAGVFGAFYFLWQMSKPSSEDYAAYEKAKAESEHKSPSDGSRTEETMEQLSDNRSEKEVYQALVQGSSSECQEFLKRYPRSAFKDEVLKMYNEKLELELFSDARFGGSLECETYLIKYPKSPHKDAVKRKLLSLPLKVIDFDCVNIHAIDISPDDQLLAVGMKYESKDNRSNDQNVMKGLLNIYDISDLRNPKEIFSYKQNDLGRIDQLRFSPNSKLLAIGTERLNVENNFSGSNEIVMLDLGSKSKIHEKFRFKQSKTGTIKALEFSPNGKFLTFGVSKYFYTLDISDMKNPVEIDKSKAHDWEIQRIKYSPDGSLIATCSAKNTGIHNDEGLLVYEGEFKLWNVINTGEVYETNSTLCHDRTCLALAFSSNSKHLATGALNNEIKIGDVSNTENVYETALLGQLEDSIFNVFFANDDKNLIISTRSEIYICKNKNYKEIELSRQLKCVGTICDMDISHDDTVISVCTNECKVYFWVTEKYLEKLLNVK